MSASEPESAPDSPSLARGSGVRAAVHSDREASSKCWNVFHKRYVVCASRVGAAEWRYRGRTLPVHDQSLMLMEPGETHRTTAVFKSSNYVVLHIDAALFATVATELGHTRRPHLRMAHVEDGRLHAVIYGFANSIAAGASLLEQQIWFAACSRLLLEYAERETPPIGATWAWRGIDRAKAYLLERFAESIPLDDLAAVSGVSRFHLARQFTKRVGLPPHAYQIRVRLERARTLLRTGMSISSVSQHLGFSDQSHFTRHFSRTYGVTPGDYARVT